MFFKYTLTSKGLERVVPKKTFQEYCSEYRSYNETILRLLARTKPLSIDEISRWTGIEKEYVSYIIKFNLYLGTVRKTILPKFLNKR
jgi:hypothetical protein